METPSLASLLQCGAAQAERSRRVERWAAHALPNHLTHHSAPFDTIPTLPYDSRMSPEKTPGLGRILVSETQISEAITRLSSEIARDYDLSNLVLVGVMDGAVPFLADLMRSFEESVTVTTARIRSYYGTTGGQLIIDSLPLRDRIDGRDVLIVEDILDSGATCELFSRKLMDLGASSVKICALLDKTSQRTHNVKAAYRGFEIPNVFVVGYGLDYDGSHRNLRNVHELNK